MKKFLIVAILLVPSFSSAKSMLADELIGWLIYGYPRYIPGTIDAAERIEKEHQYQDEHPITYSLIRYMLFSSNIHRMPKRERSEFPVSDIEVSSKVSGDGEGFLIANFNVELTWSFVQSSKSHQAEETDSLTCCTRKEFEELTETKHEYSDKYTQFTLQTTPVVLGDQKDHFAERFKCVWSAKVPFSVYETLANDIDKRFFQKND